MANTEKLTALKKIREAETAVAAALDESELTKKEREILNNLMDVLRDIDQSLLLDDLNDCLGKMQDKSKAMKNINTKIKKQIGKLEDVAKRVEYAAQAVDAIVKAFGILLKAGLI